MIYICHHCKKEFDFDGKPGIDELCPGCSSYIKCCANCGFYSETAHHSCLEPVTEFVSDKEGRNFCEYFRFGEKSKKTPGKNINKLKSDFEKLFSK